MVGEYKKYWTWIKARESQAGWTSLPPNLQIYFFKHSDTETRVLCPEILPVSVTWDLNLLFRQFCVDCGKMIWAWERSRPGDFFELSLPVIFSMNLRIEQDNYEKFQYLSLFFYCAFKWRVITLSACFICFLAYAFWDSQLLAMTTIFNQFPVWSYECYVLSVSLRFKLSI